MALLKRDHGIEVKSASSTIEEVVGRQFVERLARQRGVSLPGGDMFAERPMPSSGKKPMPGRKPEPPKPAAPTLGPPRLVKTITRPVQPTPVDEDAADSDAYEYAPPAESFEEPREAAATPADEAPAPIDEAVPDAYAAAPTQEHAETAQPEAQGVSASPEPSEADTAAHQQARVTSRSRHGRPCRATRRRTGRTCLSAATSCAAGRPFRAADTAAPHRGKPAVIDTAGAADDCAAGDCPASGGTRGGTAASGRSPGRPWRTSRSARWRRVPAWRGRPTFVLRISPRLRSAVHGRCRRTRCVRQRPARLVSRAPACRRGLAGRPGHRVPVVAVPVAGLVRPVRAAMRRATRVRRCRSPRSGRRRFHARSRWQRG